MAAERKPPQRARRGNGNGGGNGLSPIDLGPLNSFIGYALRRAQIVAFTDFIASLRELKLRPVIFGVLMMIDQNPGLPQSQICSALGIQKANFGPLLNELEERKLAVRHEGVTDRRSYALHLTPAGKELLRRARALHGEHEARLAKRLGAGGRTQLLKLLDRLNSLGGTGTGFSRARRAAGKKRRSRTERPVRPSVRGCRWSAAS